LRCAAPLISTKNIYLLQILRCSAPLICTIIIYIVQIFLVLYTFNLHNNHLSTINIYGAPHLFGLFYAAELQNIFRNIFERHNQRCRAPQYLIQFVRKCIWLKLSAAINGEPIPQSGRARRSQCARGDSPRNANRETRNKQCDSYFFEYIQALGSNLILNSLK